MWRVNNSAFKLFVVTIGLLLAVVIVFQYIQVRVSTVQSVEGPSNVGISSFGSKSYMLSLHYAEQLTMATAHYVEFINLVADWNRTGVIPYIFDSRMFGLRYFSRATNFTEFSVLINTSVLNTKLSSCLQRAADTDKGRPNLFDTVREFLSNSYRNIVVVYFIKHMQILPRAIHAAVDSDVKFGNESIKDCTDTAKDKGMSHQVEKLLDQELVLERTDSNSSDDKFRVIQAFCVKQGTPVSLIQLRDYVLNHIHGSQDARGSRKKLNVSILFISWQGRFTHTFTDLNVMNKCRFSADYSKRVLDFATQFIHSLNLHEASYISVHIRFEHLFMHQAVNFCSISMYNS